MDDTVRSMVGYARVVPAPGITDPIEDPRKCRLWSIDGALAAEEGRFRKNEHKLVMAFAAYLAMYGYRVHMFSEGSTYVVTSTHADLMYTQMDLPGMPKSDRVIGGSR